MADYSPYEILGVDPDASEAEIRAAYRRAVRTAHPDAGGTAGMFGMVREAYEILVDPERRANLDDSRTRPDVDEPAAEPPEPEWGEEVHVDDVTVEDRPPTPTSTPSGSVGGWWPAIGGFLGRLIAVAIAGALAWYLIQPILSGGGSYKPDAAGPDLFGGAEEMGLVVVAMVAYAICVVASLVGYYFWGLALLTFGALAALIAWPFAYWSPATAEERWQWISWLVAFVLYQVIVLGLAGSRWETASAERAAEEA